MRYSFTCEEHGTFLTEHHIKDGPPKYELCPVCQAVSFRNYQADAPNGIHYHCQGFERTDNDKHGDKLERLNKQWSKWSGMKPPPPASSVPRNSSEPY